ncbi:putative alpha-1,6-mannanase (GH76 family) [Paenibacillus phyllosphaerae]|uniref:Putative alpha-1,6-mannanase (GH76 family) n=1 Tax=Paenibacillus phyllosphaerae TaxID=274593 RepID=A0A7W5B4C9_9BACL|nr:carbohydrate-binding protein [Paenibacillus phyllosphaerae]MBB3114017.1 putative alpha-1,6-mannanase (GH76 family) [Paenibacillus phyllosphaerae]
MSAMKKKLLRLVTVPLIAALSLTATPAFGHSTAHAFTSSDAETAIQAFNAKFWDPGAKMFWKDSKHSNHQDFWVEAELWELVMDAYQHTNDPALKAQLRAQIDDLYEGTVAQYGEDWTNNPFNDDIMWWAMGAARAYQITGDTKYLEQAQYHFDFVYDTQWDDSFASGGIWWLNSDHSTKNACINFPAAQAAVYLYNITGEQRYLDAATRIFKWGKTMLTDGNGKIFDRIEVENGPIPDATHYNQATFIGAAVGLYQATGNAVYLDDAVEAAQFTMTRLVDANGLLNYEGPNGDLKGGKTILMRNLGYLQDVLASQTDSKYASFRSSFNDWAAFNTEMAWSHKNGESIVDGNWAGQLLAGTYESWSSASAVQALTAIAPQEAPLRYAAKDPFNKIEAERYNSGTGFVLEGALEGSLQLGGIQPGYFAAYKNVNFGSNGAIGFIARAASGTGGGNIEIRLDALDGPKVGTLRVEGTGGWNNYIDAVTLLKDDQGNQSTITGTHDVYLVFSKTKDDYLFNLNWFKFTTTDPTATDAYANLKAENFNTSEGLSKNEAGGYLDAIHNGAYASYKGIDFGTGAAGVSVRVASGNQGGQIEVKLDSLQGPTAGVIDVPALGSWDNWVDIMATIDDKLAVGVHDVYLIFHGKDGSDYPLNLDQFTFSTVKGNRLDAAGKLEAENYTSAVGVGRENGGGQTYLAGIYGPNKPYAMYNYIDFGTNSPTKLHLQAASDTSGGTVEVRIDGMNGPVIATATVTGTGGWQNFQVFSADVTTPVTGKHIVFLLFKGNDWLYNFDKFTFGDASVLSAPTPPREPVNDGIPPSEVENVQVNRDDEGISLNWDGPYDIDGDKVQVLLYKDGQQVGTTVEVKRGVQTAAIDGAAAAQSDTIVIRTVDRWGVASNGIRIEAANQSSYTFTVDGTEKVQNGSIYDDYQIFTFRVAANGHSIKAAQITINGERYELDPQAAEQQLDIDFAGQLGTKDATIIVEDSQGNRIEQSLQFEITTSVNSMRQLITRFAESGELAGPIITKLNNALDQVQHQLDKNHQDQAVKHLQDFVKHLNKANNDVKEAAKQILHADANALIADLSK